MRSIVVIIPYFGPLPKQFKFWLTSALNNPSVNFILFTDNDLKSDRNVQIFKMSFADMVTLVQSKFNFKINLKSPYKLCDYRGAYGYIFEDYIKAYDFWGFGDIDLVYGDIRYFLTDDILATYKILLGWGHLTLYENSYKSNHFFELEVENCLYYKDAFTIEKYYHFDEFLHGGMSDRWKSIHPELLWEHKPFDDVEIPRLSLNFKSVFNPSASTNLIFEYSNKKLYRMYLNEHGEITKELSLYVHFQQRKFMEIKTGSVEKYLIIPNKYIDYCQPSVSTLKRWTRPQTTARQFRNLTNKIISKVIKFQWHSNNYLKKP
jgi:hypothetical protein